MSRLQVGGMALIINDTEQENIGKVVRLVAYRGNSMVGAFSKRIITDAWNIDCDDGFMFPDGVVRKILGLTSSKNLMPLGDKETQSQFIRELQLDNV